MPNFYHYTDYEGAQQIIRSGTIQASLRNNGDTAMGNGVYLTEYSPFAYTKDELEINNWSRKTPETRRKLNNYFVISIPDSDVKISKGRNVVLFGYGNDLRLHKYPWILVDFNTERVIASYKYRVISSGPAEHTIGDYVIIDEIVNGRPVYMKSYDEFLYIGSHGSWFVGPFVGRDGGYLRQMSANSLGPDPHVPWKYRNLDLKNLDCVWSFDPTLAVKPFGKKIFMNFNLEEVEEKCPTVNICNLLQHVTATSEGKEEMVIESVLKISEDVQYPSCMTVLRNKNIVIGCGKDDSVKMFRPDGKFLALIESVRPFKNPTDLITLSTGEFVVQDDVGLQLFTENGVYVKALGTSEISKFCGLAEDENGNVITINLPKDSHHVNPEDKKGIKSNILFINRESGKVVDTINFTTPILSKLRNISFHNQTIYLTDLGLDCIYKLENRKYVGKVGGTGPGPNRLECPAEIVFDDVGNFIVADRWNQRIQIFDKQENFVGLVAIDLDMFCTPLGVPDFSIYLDTELKELYVLNNGGNSIVKYRITC